MVQETGFQEVDDLLRRGALVDAVALAAFAIAARWREPDPHGQVGEEGTVLAVEGLGTRSLAQLG